MPRLMLLMAMTIPSGCGTGSLDLAGYPDSAHERLYHDGRLGGENGYAAFDLRDALRLVRE